VQESGVVPSLLMRSVARLVVAVFFRESRIVHPERMPADGPVVVVANHFNGLVDAALLLARLPRRPSFLAKSTLWDVPLLQPVLSLAGAIPVVRRQDLDQAGSGSAASAERNRQTFDRCEALLVTGGVVALFPEGVTQAEPVLQPLRSGAARIALRACARAPRCSLVVQPVGLVFDEPERFRSRVLVIVGEPLPVDDERGDAVEAVRELTERIRGALEDVAPSYASWEEARMLDRATDLLRRTVAHGADSSPTDEETIAIHRRLVATYDRLRELHPAEVVAVVRSYRSYERLLETFGVRHDLVGLGDVSWRAALTFALHTVVLLLLLFPPAVVGILLNWIPYRVPGWVASRWAEGPEVVATYKVFASVVAFPLVWVAETAAATVAGGALAGVLTSILAPLTGFAALVFVERRRDLVERAHAWALLRRGRLVQELDRRRLQVLAGMERLRELDRLDRSNGVRN